MVPLITWAYLDRRCLRTPVARRGVFSDVCLPPPPLSPLSPNLGPFFSFPSSAHMVLFVLSDFRAPLGNNYDDAVTGHAVTAGRLGITAITPGGRLVTRVVRDSWNWTKSWNLSSFSRTSNLSVVGRLGIFAQRSRTCKGRSLKN